MNIISFPDEHDDACDAAGPVDEREWQAQERAQRAERLHLSGDADPGYRRIAAALDGENNVHFPDLGKLRRQGEVRQQRQGPDIAIGIERMTEGRKAIPILWGVDAVHRRARGAAGPRPG